MANFAVIVVFRQHDGKASARYTYESDFAPSINEPVVVPTAKWYSVGKVVQVVKGNEYEWNPSLKYQKIIQRVAI